MLQLEPSPQVTKIFQAIPLNKFIVGCDPVGWAFSSNGDFSLNSAYIPWTFLLSLWTGSGKQQLHREFNCFFGCVQIIASQLVLFGSKEALNVEQAASVQCLW